jgi:outer membrane PBP1 activator LpoA protein
MGIIYNFKLRIIIYKLRFLLLFLSIPLLFIPLNSYSQEVRIGVALPLFENSSDESRKQLGKDILDGIRFALSDYNKTAHTKVLIDIRDTKKDATTVTDIFNAFGENDSIQCVFGPVYSAELAEVAVLGDEDGIPIVSPTATGDDLASTHDYVFQLNPSYEVRGKLMANYLVKNLKMKNFVVIAEETYGVNFSKHFESEVSRLGGKILLSKSYSTSAKNITDIINEILKIIKNNDLFINLNDLNVIQREKIERAGIRSSLLDSLTTLNIDASIYYLFGKNAKKIIDTMNIKPHNLNPDATIFLQGYIDAIYIPISNPAEIGMIVPELFSYNLGFFIAGTGDWNNEEALKSNEVYLKNLIFESEYFVDNNDPNVRNLKSSLTNTKYKLNKSFLFGYDGMNVILHAISDGSITRKEINDSLLKLRSFDTIKSKVSLDFDRVNSELNILTYDDGLKRIGTYKLTK